MNFLNEKIPILFDKEKQEENRKTPIEKLFEEEFGEKEGGGEKE